MIGGDRALLNHLKKETSNLARLKPQISWVGRGDLDLRAPKFQL